MTIVELLVVVAILGILAVIGIVNYADASVRARVSRVSTDLRRLSTILETYQIDCSTYPWTRDSKYPWNLTTPIAYFTTVEQLRDPFFADGGETNYPEDPYYNCEVYDPARVRGATGRRRIAKLHKRHGAFVISSDGPSGYRFLHPASEPYPYLPIETVYDPTNGTRSRGFVQHNQKKGSTAAGDAS